jgi:hypothetical protein
MSVGALGSVAPTAGAADTGPFVTFMDTTTVGTRWLHTAAPDGTTSIALTPSGYRGYALDVSDDGHAYVVGLGRPDAVRSGWDRSYGLVLVSRETDTTTTRILTNSWDDAAISSDGTTVWWLVEGALWRYSAGVSELVDPTTFVPPQGWTTWDFVVSPDGSRAAVTYRPVSGVGGRVVAADMANGTSVPYVRYQSAYNVSSGQVVWADATDLLFATTNGSSSTWYDAQPSLDGSSGVVLADPALRSALGPVYLVTRLGSDWWGWRDVGEVTEYAVVPDLTSFSTAVWTARTDGLTSTYYRPSTGAPPVMTTPINRPTTHPYLSLSASATTYGKRLVYLSWAEYLVPLPGQTLADDYAEVDRGLLQMSTNAGSSWSNVGWTSWANPVPWPPNTRYSGNGYTPILKRTTWFRWSYPGDMLTLPSTSVVRKVVVSPTITVSKIRSSAGTTKVYGKVTRIGGTIQLWRWTGSSWVRVATVSISSAGAYSFGYRSLRRGTYKVVVPATTYWGAATKKFTI